LTRHRHRLRRTPVTPRKSQSRFTLNDNAELTFGSDNDTTIKHNNSNLLITNTTGNIDVTGNVLLNNDLKVGSGVTISPDGDVFTTGVSTFIDNIHLKADSKFIKIGANDDFTIQHNGNNTFLDNGEGQIYIRDDQGVNITNSSNQSSANFYPSDGVYLYFVGNQKLRTTNTGITVTGTAVATAFEDGNGVGINTANVRTGILDVAGIATFRDRAQFDGSIGVGIANPSQKIHIDGGNLIISNSTAPQIRINSSSSDGSSTRFAFGLATGANNFINGAQSNDACFISPSNMLFGIGSTRKFRIKTNDVLTDVDLIPSADNQTSLGRSNTRWSDLFAVDATFSGNVSIAGTLTYEDVTNVDSVGVVTARSGVLVGSGITLSPDGDIFAVGVSTFTGAIDANDNLVVAGDMVIGSDTAQAKLDVTAGGVHNAAFLKTSSDKSLIEFENSAGSTYNTRIGSATLGSGNVGLLFETGTHGSRLQAMVVDRYGKVGISSDSPTAKLDVNGDVRVGSGISLSPDGDIFSVGVTTFRDTVRFEGASGARFINYFNFGRLQFNNNVAAAFGNSSQGRVQHDGTHLKILNNASDVSGNIIIQAHSGEDSIIANQHGSIELYHNDSKKFETAETGAVVTGILTATTGTFTTGVTTSLRSNKISLGDNERISVGLSSDLSIYHDGDHNIFNASNGFVKFNNNVFQVYNQGGNNIAFEVVPATYTKLFFGSSQKLLTTNTGVVVTGILTATSFSGNITGDVTGDVTGNADTATALETARTIGGVSFDGTGNINLPGVNTSGNQDTSGNAATATVSVNAQGLTGTPNVQVGNITVTGDLTVQGTTNSETSTDTTVTGIMTARSINVGAVGGIGVTFDQGGGVFSGIVTSHTVKASKALYLPLYTTTTRDAGSFTQGAVIFNTTVKKLEYYDGTNWKSIPEVSTGLVLALDS